MAVESAIEGFASEKRRSRLSFLTLAVFAAAVVAVIIVRFQATPVPLERDEGEYALMGQLILEGVPPYSVAANMKLPGTYYAYSAIMALFGQTTTGIHMGLMVVNLLSTLFLYLLARRLLGEAAAAMAGAAFVITSVDNTVLGLFAHASQFVVMFALAGTWLLLESSRHRRKAVLLWVSGLCYGLSVLMAQSGVFFALFGSLWFLFGALKQRPVVWKRFLFESGSLAGGVALPYVVVLALMAYQGVFHKFWFWTFDYAFAYTSEVGLKSGMEHFQFSFIPIIQHYPVIWAAALAGLINIWCTESGRKAAPFLLMFILFSFFSVCPGLYFRPHYFVQLLPAAALFTGAAVMVLEEAAAKYSARSKIMQFAVLAIAVGFSLIGVFTTGRTLAVLTPGQFNRTVYGSDFPFPESVNVAKYIRNNTILGDRIAVLGSEPQIYFYAHRKPATEYVYIYPLMEHQPFAWYMQEQLIKQVEKNKPPFLVFAKAWSSWLALPESAPLISHWMKKYIREHYKPVMVTDIYPDHTLWLTGKEALSLGHSSDRLIVFKRIGGK